MESEPPELLVRDLLQCFQGEFDNYDQVGGFELLNGVDVT